MCFLHFVFILAIVVCMYDKTQKQALNPGLKRCGMDTASQQPRTLPDTEYSFPRCLLPLLFLKADGRSRSIRVSPTVAADGAQQLLFTATPKPQLTPRAQGPRLAGEQGSSSTFPRAGKDRKTNRVWPSALNSDFHAS